MRPKGRHIRFAAALGLALALLRTDVQARDPILAPDTCGRLYTDDQARRLIESAEAAVPKGQFRRKPDVLKSLGIDIRRLCNRRFQRMNLGATEAWQMSPNYDLTWWAAGPDRVPLDSETAKIHHVRVVQR
jgi:hypothetical protein